MHMIGQATVSQCPQQKKQAWVWDCALGFCAHSSCRQTLRFPEHPLPERIFNKPSCLSHERDACLSFTSSTPLNGNCHTLSFRKDTYNLVANLQVVPNWCVKRMIQIKASSLASPDCEWLRFHEVWCRQCGWNDGFPFLICTYKSKWSC